jgi:membrane-associated protease RseP (regulator of RpoE activity)
MELAWTFPISPYALVAAVIVVVVFHELGHLLAAWAVDVPVRHITIGLGPVLWRGRVHGGMRLILCPLPATLSVGVDARWDAQGRVRRSVRRDMAVAAGGPLASLLLAVLLIGIGVFAPLPVASRLWPIITGLLSLAVMITNLIPIPGLDGGHLAVLGASTLGWQLSCDQETRLHRLGIQVISLAAVLLLLVQIVHLL